MTIMQTPCLYKLSNKDIGFLNSFTLSFDFSEVTYVGNQKWCRKMYRYGKYFCQSLAIRLLYIMLLFPH